MGRVIEVRVLLVVQLLLVGALIAVFAYNRSSSQDFLFGALALCYGLVLGRLFWSAAVPTIEERRAAWEAEAWGQKAAPVKDTRVDEPAVEPTPWPKVDEPAEDEDAAEKVTVPHPKVPVEPEPTPWPVEGWPGGKEKA